MIFPKSLTKYVLTRLLKFYKYYIAAFLSLTITVVLQAFLPFLAKDIASIGEADYRTTTLLSLFGVSIGLVIFRTLSRLLFFYPARIEQKEIRVGLVNLLQTVHPSRYQSYSTGQIFQSVESDLDQLRALQGFVFLQVSNFILTLAVLLPSLASYNSALLYPLIPILVVLVIVIVIILSTISIRNKALQMRGEVQNSLIESYNGRVTIKNYSVEGAFIELFSKHCAKELQYFYKLAWRIGLGMPLLSVGIGLSLILGAKVIYEQQMGVSVLVMYFTFLFLLIEPISMFSWVGVVWAHSLSAWKRIKKLEADISRESEYEQKDLGQAKIEDSCISLGYFNQDIKLDIFSYNSVAIVSETGHGKSVILEKIADKLLASGSSVSYVGSHPHLYNDSFKNNIVLDRAGDLINDDFIRKLTDVFLLDHLAYDFKELMELEVGENGKRLSGGEVTRTALLRSLLMKVEFFIWDDPFASVDIKKEQQILEKLLSLKELGNCKFIISTHRYSSAKNCDQVLLLDKELGIVETISGNSIKDAKGKINSFFSKQISGSVSSD